MDGGHGFGHGKVGQEPGAGPQPVTQQPQQPPPGAYHYQPTGYPQPVHQQQSNTTVVINQGRVGRPPPRGWSSGICGCFEDISSCCGVFWCGSGCYPCYLSAKLNESCCLPCCLPGFGHGKVGQEPGIGLQPVTHQPHQHPSGGYPYQPQGYPQPVHHQQSNTTVVINQGRVGRPPLRDWSSGICGCFEDISSCCGVYWCGYGCYPCYLSAKLNESCCLPSCLPGGSWLVALRVKMRAENNIQGSIMGDCCYTCCCHPCVMCQLSREHDYTLANPQS